MRKLLFAIFLAGISTIFALPLTTDSEPKVNFYTIDTTWDGNFVPEIGRLNLSLEAAPNSRDIVFGIDAPYYDDPPPEGEPEQPYLGLWNYEVVEIFFLNAQDQYLEVEISPHGHHFVSLLNGQRNTIRHSLPLQVETSINGSRWTGKVTIPGDYFPPLVTRLNAYAVHGLTEKRKYLALYPTDGTTKELDMHNLSLFQPFNISKINPIHQNYSELSQIWNDSIQGRSEYARRVFKYKITRQWNNFRSKIPPTTASLQGFQGGVEINYTMPLNDENYPAESFVAIFENAEKEAIKIQLFVDGQYFVEFFNNRKNKLNQQNFPLDYRVENRLPRYVKGSVMVPPSFFPPNVKLLNMYALFGVETMLAMTLRTMEIRPGIDFRPNLSNIEHFISIDFDLLVSSKDEYSDLWRNLLKLPLPEISTTEDIPEEVQKEVEINEPPKTNEVDLINETTEKGEENKTSEKVKTVEKDKNDIKKDGIHDDGTKAMPDKKTDSLSKETELAKEDNKIQIATTATEQIVTESSTPTFDSESISKDEAVVSFPKELINDSRVKEDKKKSSEVFNRKEEIKTLHKDQPHFNKPLRFLLKKPRKPTEAEDFNPLLESQYQETTPEEDTTRMDPVQALLTETEKMVEDVSVQATEENPVPEPNREELQDRVQLKNESYSTNEEWVTTTLKVEEEQTTEATSSIFTEDDILTTESSVNDLQEPSTEREVKNQSPMMEEDQTFIKTEVEDGASSSNTDPDPTSENEDQDLNIEREKHQRRYEESSDRNELPITFKITFEPKNDVETMKKNIEELLSKPKDIADTHDTLENITSDIMSSFDALPPPHPICFTEGLVPDFFRCQVFYECVLDNGQWEVFNWRCKRGTYYDPVKVACVKGYC